MLDERPLGVSDLLRMSARRSPDRTAVVDGADRLSWAKLDRAVTNTAAAFLRTGLTAGDRVAIQLGTGIAFVRMYLGALRAGLVAVPVNPAYPPAEVDYILRDSGAAGHYDARSVVPFLAGADAADETSDPRADRPEENLSALLYTSGTSGHPKGAMLTTRALLANLDQLANVDPELLSADDIVFVPLPLSHVFGLNAGLGMALRVGATLVLSDRFDAASSLATIANERVSAVLGVPGQYAQWLREPGVAKAFAGVRFAMSGSTTLARSVVEAYAEMAVSLHDGYGLTEAAPVISVTAVDESAHARAGSIGRPLPGIEVQLRDRDGVPLDADAIADGDPGRIFVRGANLFSGYWPDGHGGPDADGWFGTGDIAVWDDDGELHLVGRSTDLVIVNGFNVYPAEVEAVLAADPAVAEVAVVGAPDEATGERVVAYVVAAAGSLLDPAALLSAAATRLARFKLPSAIEVVTTLPHTVTGKIMKWQLAGSK